MKGLFVYFSLGNQKCHMSVDGDILKAEHQLLSCHNNSFSAVVLPSAFLLYRGSFGSLFSSHVSKGESSTQPLWYRHS